MWERLLQDDTLDPLPETGPLPAPTPSTPRVGVISVSPVEVRTIEHIREVGTNRIVETRLHPPIQVRADETLHAFGPCVLDPENLTITDDPVVPSEYAFYIGHEDEEDAAIAQPLRYFVCFVRLDHFRRFGVMDDHELDELHALLNPLGYSEIEEGTFDAPNNWQTNGQTIQAQMLGLGFVQDEAFTRFMGSLTRFEESRGA